MSLYRDITIIIVAYKSEGIINETIENIGKNYKILIAENSGNIDFKKKIEKEYENCTVYLTGDNLGVSKAVNILLKKVETKFSLFITPDAFPKDGCINLLYKELIANDEVAIASPRNINEKLKNLFGYYPTKNFFHKDDIQSIPVDWVVGGVMLLNNYVIKKIGFFDENFFLDYEEIDLCIRARKNNYKILFCNHAKTVNLDHQSSKFENKIKAHKTRIWHYGWSMHYFHKKHFNLREYVKVPLSMFFLANLKIIYHLICFNKIKLSNYFYFISGYVSSILGKNSYLR